MCALCARLSSLFYFFFFIFIGNLRAIILWFSELLFDCDPINWAALGHWARQSRNRRIPHRKWLLICAIVIIVLGTKKLVVLVYQFHRNCTTIIVSIQTNCAMHWRTHRTTTTTKTTALWVLKRFMTWNVTHRRTKRLGRVDDARRQKRSGGWWRGSQAACLND